MADEQSVMDFIAAGLELLVDVRLPKEQVFTSVGSALQLDQQNQAMNHFVDDIVEKMRGIVIYTLLLKGQGVA